jgi:vesicle coat complex subunit
MESYSEMKDEKPCWLYINTEPLTSYRDVQTKMASREISEKEEAMKSLLGSITNDDNYPDNLMMSAINNLSIVEDLRIKKLLFLFWEVNSINSYLGCRKATIKWKDKR